VTEALAVPSPLEWTPALSVGVPELDRQHGELFRRAERLVHALATGGPGEVDPLVHSLHDFLYSHLEFEEQRMAETEYPGLKVHQDAHWRFKDDVEARTRVYQRRGPSPAMSLAIHDWLAGWLYPHLGGDDRELGHWLASHPARREA